MQNLKHNNFNDRRNTAETARKAMLDRFRMLPKADDPVVLERLAAQKAIGDAREARRTERKASLAAEAERIAAETARELAEKAAKDAQEAAEAAAIALEHEERASMLHADKKARAIALAAEQKATRDARYAARKARKR